MTLEDYHRVWDAKPVLRAIYSDFYERIASQVVPGPILEIGGGIGNLRGRFEDVISSDIQFAPWLDCVADAQRLPFDSNSLANIVMVDVLHHLEFPIQFFREAERVLRAGGRIIMIEPAITWGSSLFYRLLHHEPVRTGADPLADGVLDESRDPYDANQAIPTLLATRDRGRLHVALRHLKLVKTQWFSFVTWPLSGGFKRWSLISAPWAERILRLERRFEPIVGRFIAFRVMLTMDKMLSPRSAVEA